MAYKVGDIVFWATARAAGKYTVIGHPKGKSHVLVFAGGGKVEVEDRQPTGGRESRGPRRSRMRYLNEFPGSLEGWIIWIKNGLERGIGKRDYSLPSLVSQSSTNNPVIKIDSIPCSCTFTPT